MAEPNRKKASALLPISRKSSSCFFIVALLVVAFILPGCQPFSDFFDYQLRSKERKHDSTTVSEPYDSHSTSDEDLPSATSQSKDCSPVTSESAKPTESSSESTGSSATTETPKTSPTIASTSSSIPTKIPTPKPTATATPKPTAKPTATVTPKPSASPTPTPTPTPIVVPTTGTYQPAMADQVITLVNEERAAEGLSALSSNSHLTSSADIRSPEIVVVWSHTRPDGSSCSTAVSGLSWSRFGENIAKGYSTAESVMTGWMNSEGHRANILDPDYTMIGVSCYLYEGKYYWVQHFAA
ncbi:MAG: hypothetical protein JW780_05900 [Clostridiales bacterium]|nr:hypothetical protein [Clostridiales bacterium]